MIDKLISTTEFVLLMDTEEQRAKLGSLFNTVITYAKFISQPLKIEMFASITVHKDNTFEYVNANNLVLFKNIEVEDWIEDFRHITLAVKDSKYLHSINYNVENKYFFFDGDSVEIPVTTIEDVVSMDLELTEYCLTKLDLNL